MKIPTTKTLIVLMVASFVGAALVMPAYYPAPAPVLSADGLPVHKADGGILVHRDMASFYRMMIPTWVFLFCGVVSLIWLSARLLRFIYERREHQLPAT